MDLQEVTTGPTEHYSQRIISQTDVRKRGRGRWQLNKWFEPGTSDWGEVQDCFGLT
jgi:hypothetical protein